MRGLPAVLQTRADVEMLLAFLGTEWATPERIEWGLKTLRGLLATRQVYQFDRILGPDEEPDGPEPEYRVVTDEDGERRQNRLVDNPNGKFYRLGLTETEVENWITKLEAAHGSG